MNRPSELSWREDSPEGMYDLCEGRIGRVPLEGLPLRSTLGLWACSCHEPQAVHHEVNVRPEALLEAIGYQDKKRVRRG